MKKCLDKKTLSSVVVLACLGLLFAGCYFNDSRITNNCYKHSAGLAGCKNYNSQSKTSKEEEKKPESLGSNKRQKSVADRELEDLKPIVQMFSDYCKPTKNLSNESEYNLKKIEDRINDLRKQSLSGKRGNEREEAACVFIHEYLKKVERSR
jgi:septal ring factor EnvC (AmiA/AmiB activator)